MRGEETQHGDVQRKHRHLYPTPVAPTYYALPADVDIPIDLEVVDEPMAVVAPPLREPQPSSPEPRRNPTGERKLLE